jgi:very-long-chain enoyl-CoA reductase
MIKSHTLISLEPLTFIPSHWAPLSVTLYGIFGVFAVLLGFLDYYEIWAMRYSKFGTSKGVPSRLGMTILYALPIAVATVLAWGYLPHASAVQWVVFGLVVLHFVKRTLEVLFVHNYSGYIQPFTFVVIVFTYSLIAGTISALNAQALEKNGCLVLCRHRALCSWRGWQFLSPQTSG